jgi:hypothetical protein
MFLRTGCECLAFAPINRMGGGKKITTENAKIYIHNLFVTILLLIHFSINLVLLLLLKEREWPFPPFRSTN